MSDKKNKPNEFCNDFDSEILLRPQSGTDCTGLIPSMPENDWQKEAYNELYNYIPGSSDKIIKKNKPIEM